MYCNLYVCIYKHPNIHNLYFFLLPASFFCSGCGIPRELFPALSAGRLLLALTFAEPLWALGTNLALSPLYVYLSIAKDSEAHMISSIVNEVFVVLQLTLVCSYVHMNLKRTEASTMSMQAKQKEAETSVAAARRLLSVLCDTFVQLTGDFKVKKPQRSFMDLLAAGCNVEGMPMMELISPSDRGRFLDVVTESDNVTHVDSAARSLSLELMDTQGKTMEARLYFVQVPCEGETVEHLIGIKEVASNQAEGAKHVDFFKKLQNVSKSSECFGLKIWLETSFQC